MFNTLIVNNLHQNVKPPQFWSSWAHSQGGKATGKCWYHSIFEIYKHWCLLL